MRLGVMILGAMALASTGCAWMFKGSTQEVEFVSTPEGADVRLDARYLGATPAKASIDRNSSQNIVVSKDGYGDQRARVQRHPDTAWWIWDIGTCAIPVLLCVPLVVDAISGAWFSLEDDVRVKLDALPAAPPVQRAAPSEVQEPPPSPPGRAL